MADDVSSNEIINENGRYVVHLTAISAGTGESGAVKVDLSALTDANGRAPLAADIEKIHYDIQGYTSVRLLWDHDTDELAATLSAGQGTLDFSEYGGLRDQRGTDAGTAADGDIILTTNGHSSGDTYSITLSVKLRAQP